jgi:hypothetical protein
MSRWWQAPSTGAARRFAFPLTTGRWVRNLRPKAEWCLPTDEGASFASQRDDLSACAGSVTRTPHRGRIVGAWRSPKDELTAPSARHPAFP